MVVISLVVLVIHTVGLLLFGRDVSWIRGGKFWFVRPRKKSLFFMFLGRCISVSGSLVVNGSTRGVTVVQQVVILFPAMFRLGNISWLVSATAMFVILGLGVVCSGVIWVAVGGWLVGSGGLVGTPLLCSFRKSVRCSRLLVARFVRWILITSIGLI